MGAKEMTFTRDARASLRHRLYGKDCPLADLDGFIWYEYFNRSVAALIEMKYWTTDPNTVMASANTAALRDLAQRANLPAWICYYDPSRWVYRVETLNDLARDLFAKRYHTEREYVEALYRLRGQTAPEEVLSRLNATKEPIDDDD
jgi:hypothetical protein